jgi:putative transposase
VAGDMGVEVPLMLSTGESFDVPRPTERERERERRLERSLARKRRGSNNKAKARRALARHRAKVRRRRLDALRKIAATVAKNHGLIVLEDLNVKNMTASAAGMVDEPGTNVAQKAGLNRAILKVGWYSLYLYIKQAAAKHGGRVLLMPPHHTSQTCPDPACGHVGPDNRAERATFKCVACGHAGHADHVAARNILARGLAMPAEADGSQSAEEAAKPKRQKRLKTTAGGLPAPAACGDLGAARSVKQEGRPARAGGSELHP